MEFDNKLSLLPEFRHLRNTGAIISDPVLPTEDIFSSDEELMSLIYAPDPETGIPRSDIALMMSRDAAPEVREYIQRTLYSPVQSSSTDSADFALDCVKDRRESVQNYANRLREICTKYASTKE